MSNAARTLHNACRVSQVSVNILRNILSCVLLQGIMFLDLHSFQGSHDISLSVSRVIEDVSCQEHHLKKLCCVSPRTSRTSSEGTVLCLTKNIIRHCTVGRFCPCCAGHPPGCIPFCAPDRSRRGDIWCTPYSLTCLSHMLQI